MSDRYVVHGLKSKVEILVDEWGVPHIYATSAHDAYLAQGFNAARDRLWQLDYARRRGLGLLAEAFGEHLVPWDRAARRLLYRGDLRSEWLAYSNTTKAVAEAFVAGINAYIELTERGLADLPVEFTALGYRPGRWNPADVARMRAHGLSFNAPSELARALTLYRWGAEVERLRKVLEPDHEPIIAEGLDLSALTPQVLDEYLRGTLPAQFTGANLDSIVPDRSPVESDGSNSWVIAPDHTTTGRAILANDPHRATATIPSLRYIVHLRCDEFDVIGGGEPILPGVSIGHNGMLAFGLTIFPIDQEDLVLLNLEPGNPRRYLHQGDWISFETVSETIPVRGSDDVQVTLDFSRFGPVMHLDAEVGTAVALSAAWLEPGAARYLGSMEYMTARSIEEFMAAMNRWGAPPENQVVADTDGRIAWKPGGIIPVRRTWDGLLPVPGDGRHRWEGFYDADVLPERIQRDGFIATANNRLLNDDHDPDLHVTYEWSAPYRHQRITEWLEEARAVSVHDAFDFQLDELSIPARETVDFLTRFETFANHELGRLLIGWDRRMSSDSRAAFTWERWVWRHFLPQLFSVRIQELGHAADTEEILAILIPEGTPDRDLRPGLREMNRQAGADPARLEQVLKTSLDSAQRELRTDFPQTVWGDVHTGYAVHPLAELLTAAGIDADLVMTNSRPRSGSGETVGLASYARPDDYRQVTGSTFRVVIDVGDWNNSLALNAPAQTGDLASGRAQDSFDDWIEGRPFPLLYSRERIEKHTRQRILLTPNA